MTGLTFLVDLSPTEAVCLAVSAAAGTSIPLWLFVDADPCDFDPRPAVRRAIDSGRFDPLLIRVGPAKHDARLAARDAALTAAALLALLFPATGGNPMTIFEQIIAAGNRPQGNTPNRITCTDGFTLSVIAGPGVYCTPRPSLLDELPDGLVSDAPRDYPGPYTAVEVGFPSARPEPWGEWSQRAEDEEAPTSTVYGYVPVEMVRALIESHGGEETTR